MIYKTSKNLIPGTSYREVEKTAKKIFLLLKSRTKRTPYIRSKYFKGDKIFLNIFWQHLYGKHERDKVRRLKFYDCALDLIRNSANDPTTRENFRQKDELLHRFLGITKQKTEFIVQIKENKRTGRKDFLSVFPV